VQGAIPGSWGGGRRDWLRAARTGPRSCATSAEPADIAGQHRQQQAAGAGGSAQHLECVVGADPELLGENAFALLDDEGRGMHRVIGLVKARCSWLSTCAPIWEIGRPVRRNAGSGPGITVRQQSSPVQVVRPALVPGQLRSSFMRVLPGCEGALVAVVAIAAAGDLGGPGVCSRE
jgi:hypothetical protein